jgi:alkylation response protein AidB-like acyl-CoA dehydrogenase
MPEADSGEWAAKRECGLLFAYAIPIPVPMDPNPALLQTAETLLRTSIAPNAEAIDQDPEALRWALHELGKANLLALRLPSEWGGAAAHPQDFQQFQTLVARYSGSLAFLQAQHQSAGSLLAQSDNTALKEKYLPYMGSGQMLMGISFAHLRRAVSPVKALPVDGGYQLDGRSPWVTGSGFFQNFIVAAELPDGQAVYGVVPFQTTPQSKGGELVCGEPMRLAAMQTTQTVTVDFTRWFLPAPQVITIKPETAMEQSDRRQVLHHAFYAIGCAQAGLDLLLTLSEKRAVAAIATAHDQLAQELETCWQSLLAAPPNLEHFAENLSLRAWAIELANRCAHAAVTAASGIANCCHHPAQRIYREAMALTVFGQTTAVLEATLARIAGKL